MHAHIRITGKNKMLCGHGWKNTCQKKSGPPNSNLRHDTFNTTPPTICRMKYAHIYVVCIFVVSLRILEGIVLSFIHICQEYLTQLQKTWLKQPIPNTKKKNKAQTNINIRMISQGRNGVSNHRQIGYLFNSLFRLSWNKNQTPPLTLCVMTWIFNRCCKSSLWNL